jgi:hypothetical protein
LLLLSDDADPLGGQTAPVFGDAAVIGGAGTIVSAGTIASAFAATGSGELAITVASFTNTGVMQFDPAAFSQSETVTIKRTSKVFSWQQDFAPTLDISSNSFVNDGNITLSGGTLELDCASFSNAGDLLLPDATGQAFVTNGTYSVQSVTLPTMVQVQAGVTAFTNTGTIAADTLTFADNVSLPALGTMQGALVFTGTLDLGGRTLDASGYGHVTISGTVRNGTLLPGSGTLSLDGATLQGVAVLPGGALAVTGPITVIDPPAGVGRVALNATTAEIGFAAETLVNGLTIGDAGQVGTVALLTGAAVTWGTSTTLEATGPGAVVDVTGSGSLLLNGRIEAAGARIVVAPTLDGSGVLALCSDDGAAAAVTLDALAPSAALTVDFGAGPALLVLPGAGAGLTFSGLAAGDVVDFVSVSSNPGTLFAAAGATIAGGTLDVTGASGQTARVAVANAAGGLKFATFADGSGGTLVSMSCFRHGTRITTPTGAVAVEDLAIGDAVLTASGAARRVKWLGRRRYTVAEMAANRHLRPVRFAAGALAPGVPGRPLEVSPEHAVLVGCVLVPAGALVNGSSITRAHDGGAVAYVHIELDGHDLVLAEGAAAETFVPVIGRMMFDNADEFAALYPEAMATVPRFTRPRAECGESVERARRLLASRAPAVRDAAPPGTLRGHIERIGDGKVEGWACDDSGDPVALELSLAGQPAGRVLANRYRPDLDFHGLPACGFVAEVPRGVAVALRRIGDGARLPISEQAMAA